MKTKILLVLLHLFPLVVFADKEPKDDIPFLFAYVTHYADVRLEKIDSLYLNDMFKTVTEIGGRAIIYISNGEEPIIAKIGFEHGQEKQEYDKIIEATRELYHTVNYEYDLNRLIELFNEYNFVDSNGKILYSRAVLNFFVSSEFWNSHGHTGFLAPLAFCLNMNQFDDRFERNYLFDSDDYERLSESDRDKHNIYKMGEENLGGFANEIVLQEY